MRGYSLSRASDELHALVEEWYGKISITEYGDVYDPSGIWESFMNWDERINDPSFTRQLYDRDLLCDPEWMSWFVDNGGDVDEFERKHGDLNCY
jgi:hypothetical protein